MNLKPFLVFGILSMTITPAFSQWPLTKELAEPKSSESGQNLAGSGRFQVFITPQAKGSTFLLDSQTGRLWIMKKDSSTGDFSVNRIPVDEVDNGESSAKKK